MSKEKFNTRKIIRSILLGLFDAILANLMLYYAFLIRFDGNIPARYIDLIITLLPITSISFVFLFVVFGLYKSLWQYASIDELIKLIIASILGTTLLILVGLTQHLRIPWSVVTIFVIAFIVASGGVRLAYRMFNRIKSQGFSWIFKSSNKRKVMIVGAGTEAAAAMRALQNDSLKEVVVVVDDDAKKIGMSFQGIPVKGDFSRIEEIATHFNIAEIVIALSKEAYSNMFSIIGSCNRTGCVVRILNMTDGTKDISIREVRTEDLLGRDPVNLDINSISEYLENKCVFVTGGGGSIGSEICRQIAKFKPAKIIIFDIYENNAYELVNELKNKYNNELSIEIIIGSIRDYERLDEVFNIHRPNVVFHAAAHKHVPLMEHNAKEAVKNNIFGTNNVCCVADKYNVERFVLISTDKAVNPTNIMGLTKRFAEIIVRDMNKKSKTLYAAVRFGNVLGSSGSVVPLFKKQIENGGPVTITHQDIVRYFMTVDEAAKLVIQAGALSQGGEIFVLDMGKPVKIIDLARNLIELSGLTPDKDIKIEVTGLRPGEKLFEELVLDGEEIKTTNHKKIFMTTHENNKDFRIKETMDILQKARDSKEQIWDILTQTISEETNV